MARENETTTVRKISNGHIIDTSFYDTKTGNYRREEKYVPNDPLSKAKSAPSKKSLQKATQSKKK